jgi:hypothetical protein
MRNFWAMAAILATTTAGRVDASVDINIDQVGANVVLTGSGSLNIGGMTFVDTTTVGSGVGGDVAAAYVGPTFATVDTNTGLTGPTSFGTGAFHFASSGSGSLFGLDFNVLEVPHGYVSGTQLTGSATLTNTTLTALGLDIGTFTFTLPHDTVTVQIGSTAVVPEPLTAIVAVFGAVAYIAYGSRHRRAQRRQAAA